MASEIIFVCIPLLLLCLFSMFTEAGRPKGAISIKDIKDRIRHPVDFDVWVVGMYMASHKYFDVDWRYQVGDVDEDDQVFYKKFPTPSLRELHTVVAKKCGSSASDCINEIKGVALKSATMQHFFRSGPDDKSKYLLPWAPFKTNFEKFRYRQTAAYYLCWHTLMKDPYLKFEPASVSCLEFLNMVDELPEIKRKKFSRERKQIIKDRRDALFRKDPLLCAHLWFCPDPCFGREKHGNYEEDGFKSPGNPCIDLKNKTCGWEPKANFNVRGLMKNKFNVSCDCAGERDGFEWSSRFGLCVDTDECYENTHDCPYDKVCLNTVGSFMCTCPKGFKEKSETKKCEKLSIIHEGATILDVKVGLGHTVVEEKDIIDELMEMIGFGSGALAVSPSLTFIWTMSIGLHLKLIIE